MTVWNQIESRITETLVAIALEQLGMNAAASCTATGDARHFANKEQPRTTSEPKGTRHGSTAKSFYYANGNMTRGRTISKIVLVEAPENDVPCQELQGFSESQ